MGFVGEEFGLLPVRLGARRGAPDGFDEQLEGNRRSPVRGARGVGVGYKSRRRESAKRFDGLRLAERWDKHEARLLAGSSSSHS
jgi:hypothetical protein